MTIDEKVKAIKAQTEEIAARFRQFCEAEECLRSARSSECRASNALTAAKTALAEARAKLEELIGDVK